MFNTLFQLLAHKHSESLQQASCFLFISGYIYFMLTGNKINEQTISSTSQLLNINGKAFDSLVLKGLGVNENIFASSWNQAK
ncbi:MAG: hypothetical protein HC896_11565 [Bacteroidales bacterium]|nr:hypothetical protein [Bacteroidales bacterium]